MEMTEQYFLDKLNLPRHCLGYKISLSIWKQNIQNLWISYNTQNKERLHRKSNTFDVLVKLIGQNSPRFRKTVIYSPLRYSNAFFWH